MKQSDIMVGLWTFLLLVLLAAGSESHTLPLSRLASAPQRTPLPVLHSQISTRRFATTDPDCCDSINYAAELVASNNAEVPRELASWEVCLCGALATATGDFALHPVDTIKITQQAASGVASGVFATAHDIIRRNGLRGLYSGLLPYLVADGLSGAIKFASFEAGKTFLQKKLPEKYHGLSKFLSAAIAMLACSIVLVPGEVIKTRLQAGVATSFTPAIADTLKHDGVKGLFAGYYATLVRDVPYTMLELGIYENLKTFIANLRKKAGKSHSNKDELLAAAITGGVTAFVTTPLDLIKTKLMLQTSAGGQYAGVADALVSIYRTGGLSALFVGSTARVAWLLPFTTIYLGMYELAKRRMLARSIAKK